MLSNKKRVSEVDKLEERGFYGRIFRDYADKCM
jgi:hypothetical protein